MSDISPELIIAFGAFALATFDVLVFDIADRMPRHRRVAVWTIGLLGALPGLAGVLGGFVLFVRGSASPVSWTLFSAGLLLEINANVLIGKLKSRS